MCGHKNMKFAKRMRGHEVTRVKSGMLVWWQDANLMCSCAFGSPRRFGSFFRGLFSSPELLQAGADVALRVHPELPSYVAGQMGGIHALERDKSLAFYQKVVLGSFGRSADRRGFLAPNDDTISKHLGMD